MVEIAEIEKNGIDKKSIRNNILDFEQKISNCPDAFFGDSDKCPLKHSFADGIYVREIFIPAGTLLTGKLHKHSHPNFLLEGEVDVFTESNGIEHLKAPMSIISKEGTKRVVLALRDTVWITVHLNPTNTRDLKELEELIIAKDYNEYENYIKNINGHPTLIEKCIFFIKKILYKK